MGVLRKDTGIRSMVLLDVVHAVVELSGVYRKVRARCNRQPMSLTVEKAYEVDLQGRQLAHDKLAVHDFKVSHTYDIGFLFGDSCV